MIYFLWNPLLGSKGFSGRVCMKKRMVVLLFLSFLVLTGLGAQQREQLERLATYEGLAAEMARETPSIILLDVRTSREYNEGHIPGARNIPVDMLITSLPTRNPNTIIVIYDRTGSRSGRARIILESFGFRNLVVFGAMRNWQGELASR